MKRLVFILVLQFLALDCSAKAFVAVLETYSTVISSSEKRYVTSKIRTVARESLNDDFTVMSRENIQEMLPPGKSIEDCEGTCLVETGRNISADYICQGRVAKVGRNLYVTVELYNTATNDLVSSFSEVAENMDQMISVLEKKLARLFAPLSGKSVASDGVQFYDSERFAGLVPPKFHIVKFNSKQCGVSLTVDGAPEKKCSRMPCSVELSEGEHKFSFSLPTGFLRDTVVHITSDIKSIWAADGVMEDENLDPCDTVKDVRTIITDSRDGNKYRTVKFGNATWMVENLRYKTKNSMCYEDNCKEYSKYGSYYTWDEAVNSCPAGWHLPDTTDARELLRFVAAQYWDGDRNMASKLMDSATLDSLSKAKNIKSGIKPSGFDAVFGGHYMKVFGLPVHVSAFEQGYLWLHNSYPPSNAWMLKYDLSGWVAIYDAKKREMLPVRCVKNAKKAARP